MFGKLLESMQQSPEQGDRYDFDERIHDFGGDEQQESGATLFGVVDRLRQADLTSQEVNSILYLTTKHPASVKQILQCRGDKEKYPFELRRLLIESDGFDVKAAVASSVRALQAQTEMAGQLGHHWEMSPLLADIQETVVELTSAQENVQFKEAVLSESQLQHLADHYPKAEILQQSDFPPQMVKSFLDDIAALEYLRVIKVPEDQRDYMPLLLDVAHPEVVSAKDYTATQYQAVLLDGLIESDVDTLMEKFKGRSIRYASKCRESIPGIAVTSGGWYLTENVITRRFSKALVGCYREINQSPGSRFYLHPSIQPRFALRMKVFGALQESAYDTRVSRFLTRTKKCVEVNIVGRANLKQCEDYLRQVVLFKKNIPLKAVARDLGLTDSEFGIFREKYFDQQPNKKKLSKVIASQIADSDGNMTLHLLANKIFYGYYKHADLVEQLAIIYAVLAIAISPGDKKMEGDFISRN